MELGKYQKEAFRYALPSAQSLVYMLLGVGNESGEAQGKLKKVLRGDVHIEDATEDLGKEVGDVLWYLAGAATMLGLSLDDIARENLDKLKSRQDRGVLQGNGDNR